MTNAYCQRCKNAISIKAAPLCLSPSGIVRRKDRDLADFQLSRQKRSKSVGVTPSACSHHHAGFSCAVRNIALALVTLSSITSWFMHHASLYAHGLQIGPTFAPVGHSFVYSGRKGEPRQRSSSTVQPKGESCRPYTPPPKRGNFKPPKYVMIERME